MGAEKIELLPIRLPFSDPPAVDTDFPISVNTAMALPAQPVRFFKGNLFSGDESQIISFFKVMAVKAPHPFGMMKTDVLMHPNEYSRLRIRKMDIGAEKCVSFLHFTVDAPDVFLMAGLTGIQTLVNKGRRHRI